MISYVGLETVHHFRAINYVIDTAEELTKVFLSGKIRKAGLQSWHTLKTEKTGSSLEDSNDF